MPVTYKLCGQIQLSYRNETSEGTPELAKCLSKRLWWKALKCFSRFGFTLAAFRSCPLEEQFPVEETGVYLEPEGCDSTGTSRCHTPVTDRAAGKSPGEGRSRGGAEGGDRTGPAPARPLSARRSGSGAFGPARWPRPGIADRGRPVRPPPPGKRLPRGRAGPVREPPRGAPHRRGRARGGGSGSAPRPALGAPPAPGCSPRRCR